MSGTTLTLSFSDAPSWVGTRTAGLMLKVSKQRVYQLGQAGAIVGRQMDGQWLWSVRSIEARLALMRSEYGQDGGLKPIEGGGSGADR
jgi:hypothetical protein